MRANPPTLIAFKMLFGLLGFSAVVTEIATLVDRGTFVASNFFSYFTIQNNILTFATLILSAVAVAAGKNDRLDMLRAAVTTYILVVGIGFAVLLADIQDVPLTAVPWDNTVLHYLMPLVMLLDYVIDPPRRRLPFRAGLVWLLYPVAYVAYSLVRGAAIDWYPYPFLNPATGGYAAVAVTVVGLLALTLALIWVVTRLSGRGAAPTALSASEVSPGTPTGKP